MGHYLRFIIISAAILLFSLPAARAGVSLPPDVSLTGFLLNNFSIDTSHRNPDGSDFKLAEQRLELNLQAWRGPFTLYVKQDAFYDDIAGGTPTPDTREAYLDFTSSKWGMRIGRQVITWGVGDLLFINDVFPKNYAAFYSGRPLEYLKDGVDGAKIGFYPGFASFDLVVVPFFTPDTLPSPNRFWQFIPPIPPSSITNGNGEPSTNFNNSQVALRAYREIAGLDVSAYYYRGFFSQPSEIPENPSVPTRLIRLYPQLSDYGASAQGNVWGGVLSLEIGYYDSMQSGINPAVTPSQIRSLIGYQKELWKDFTVGVQYYREDMQDRSEYVEALPPGYPVDDRELTTIRLTQFLRHQTLRLSFFAFYSPSSGDYMLNPEIKYAFSDHVWAALGENTFGGAKNTQFGQFARDDNTYVQVEYTF